MTIGQGGWEVANLVYDIRIYGVGGVVYERFWLVENLHAIESSLQPCSEYRWSVRARFSLNEFPRATECLSGYSRVAMEHPPWLWRRSVRVPTQWVAPPTLLYPIILTPGLNGEECEEG
jgi:hypothetical protein